MAPRKAPEQHAILSHGNEFTPPPEAEKPRNPPKPVHAPSPTPPVVTAKKMNANEFRSAIIYKIFDLADEQGMSRSDIRFILSSMKNIEPFFIRAFNLKYPSATDVLKG